MFVLVRTSNPGAADLQDRFLDGRLLFEAVAGLVAGPAGRQVGRSGYSAIGAVVGGTAPEHARAARELLPHSFFLVPGFGAQGGDPTLARRYCDPDGLGSLFSSSRAVLYPHLGAPGPWTRGAVRQAAATFIRSVRAALSA